MNKQQTLDPELKLAEALAAERRAAQARRPSRAEAEAAVRTLIRWTGDDPTREGLAGTPERVARAYEEYFAGYHDDPVDILQRTFEDLGIPHQVLDVSRMALIDLNQFSTLVLDFRAYPTQPALAQHPERILRFCRAGGRVVVFYHKTGEWNPRAGRPSLAPFPFAVSGNRVTEEDAAVTMLEPDHRIWNYPHKIEPEDFNGWVQERGLYFAGTWDEAWTPLMSMHDENSQPLEGALLYTNYGRGQYIYCALSIYRQLRNGHQGATRILLNLLTR